MSHRLFKLCAGLFSGAFSIGDEFNDSFYYHDERVPFKVFRFFRSNSA